MATFIKGDIVVIPFPFSDLTSAKRRPALIVAILEGDDIILCQITSQFIKDSYAISLNDTDFATGSLKQKSYIRPNRLFIADSSIVLYQVGHLIQEKIDETIDKIVNILRK